MPFGVMMPKRWIYEKGGRPAIYQPEKEYELLHQDQQFRHVRLEKPGDHKDFSFEREWRLKGDLDLDPSVCTLVVPTREWDYRLREEHAESDMRKARLFSRFPFSRMTDFKWHILALGDLGADIVLPGEEP